MRTITQEKTLYKIDELSPRKRTRALELLAQLELDDFHDLASDIIHEWHNALDELGFGNADIRYSGFSSQGDGCSFTADIDLSKFASGFHVLDDVIDEISASLQRQPSLYVNTNTCEVMFHYRIELTTEQETALDQLRDSITWIYQSRCNAIYYDLMSQYDDIQEEQHLIEIAACNEYEFDEHGEIAARFGEVIS